MIEQEAVVVSVSDGKAEVEIRRQTACGGCQAGGACGTSLIAQLFERRINFLSVDNAAAAVPGDRVVIGLDDSVLQRASFIVYALPLIGLLLGALFGEMLAEIFRAASREPLAIFMGLLGMLAALAWVRRYSQRCHDDPRYRPRILRVLPRPIITMKIQKQS